MTSTPSRPVTLRATSSVVTFWVVAAACLLGLGDAAVRGSWQVVAQALPPTALGLWVAWFLLYRPSIRLEATRLVVVNLGRITEVPWSRVDAVRRRFQIVIDLDDGAKVECWGGPFPTRTGTKRSVVREGGTDDAALDAVRIAHQSAPVTASPTSPQAPIVRRWDVASLACGAALTVACVAALLLAGM